METYTNSDNHSWIAKLHYDRANEYVEVETDEARVFVVDEVDPVAFTEWVASPSWGRHYNLNHRHHIQPAKRPVWEMKYDTEFYVYIETMNALGEFSYHKFDSLDDGMAFLDSTKEFVVSHQCTRKPKR